MTYLLDVNVLIALGCKQHVHHQRVRQWILSLAGKGDFRLATCAITELGFVRIAGGNTSLLENLAIAQQELRQLKTHSKFVFLCDSLSAEQLPDWVKHSKQTTDGYLLELATQHHSRLATLDTAIPGAELIPQLSDIEWVVREEPAAYGVAA